MSCQESSSLSDFADLAQVVIAIANLLLAAYLFFYQKVKDKDSDRFTTELHEQNIKLQWFKELVVQPNMTGIINFYNGLNSLREKITDDNLPIESKEQINEFVKGELIVLRKQFIDLLFQIDTAFARQAKDNLDSLVDSITEAIFNDELKLTRAVVFEKHIGDKISYSRNSLMAQLYNYKGLNTSNVNLKGKK